MSNKLQKIARLVKEGGADAEFDAMDLDDLDDVYQEAVSLDGFSDVEIAIVNYIQRVIE